jgi:hypothetical protein
VLTETRLAAIAGERRVEAVEVARIVDGKRWRLACDTVVFTGDWIPEHELARRGGLDADAATRGPRVDGAFRTSVAGVFAAGNLVHAAEPADVAALGGRHAAGAIAAFLRDGAWPTAPAVPIVAEAPIAWVAPSAIAPDAPPRAGRLAFRMTTCVPRGRLVVAQGARVLWEARRGPLAPARSLYLPAGWTRAVDPAGPPVAVRFIP